MGGVVENYENVLYPIKQWTTGIVPKRHINYFL
jgi:hypothetical protein